MLNFIFKWVLILNKKYLLFSVKSEHAFFSEYFADELAEDREDLGKKFEEEKALGDKADYQKMATLQADIVKLGQIQNRLKDSKRTESELSCFIDTLKKM